MGGLLPELTPGQMLSAHHPRASARPHMTRHHHPLGGTLFRTFPPQFTRPCQILGSLAYLSFQSNLPFRLSQPGRMATTLNFLHPLSASVACFPAVIPSLPLYSSYPPLSTRPSQSILA